MMREVVAVLVAAVALGPAAHAGIGEDTDDYVPAPSAAPEGVGLVEHLGAQVPLDARFRDQDGRDVTLRDVLRDQLPVVLTFNYSNCTMLCSQQLNAFAAALAQLDFVPGQEFRIVTIDLDPTESPKRATEMRATYVDALPPERRAAARRGWTYLVARAPDDDSQIRAVAAAVGFSYRYVPERKEYAHPTALIFLSSRGAVTRYVGGIEYAADTLRESIVRAGLAEGSTTVGFVLTCFHYLASGRAHAAVVTMQIAAAVFLAGCALGAAIWRSRRKRRSNHG